MHLSNKVRGIRSRGALPVRLLLAIAIAAGAFAFTAAVGVEPASAGTVEWSANEIVITSDRLHDVTVRATQIITLRSNGDMFYQVDAHNSGATRKFFYTVASVEIPGTTMKWYFNLADSHFPVRIDGNTYKTWGPLRQNSQYSSTLASRWNEVLTSTINYSFRLDASRING